MQGTQGTPRSYRCTYFPKDANGWPLPADSGVLPHVQVQAANAEQAHLLAHGATGCPIAEVVRIEHPHPGVAMSADLRAWLRGGQPAGVA
jgi:hypothetical protein